MARTKQEHTDSFDAVTDDGDRETIHVYTTMIEIRPINGPIQWLPGSKRLISAGGGHVNMNRDGTFTELETGRVFKANWKP